MRETDKYEAAFDPIAVRDEMRRGIIFKEMEDVLFLLEKVFEYEFPATLLEKVKENAQKIIDILKTEASKIEGEKEDRISEQEWDAMKDSFADLKESKVAMPDKSSDASVLSEILQLSLNLMEQKKAGEKVKEANLLVVHTISRQLEESARDEKDSQESKVTPGLQLALKSCMRREGRAQEAKKTVRFFNEEEPSPDGSSIAEPAVSGPSASPR